MKIFSVSAIFNLGFFAYISSKRKTFQQKLPILLIMTELVTEDECVFRIGCEFLLILAFSATF